MPYAGFGNGNLFCTQLKYLDNQILSNKLLFHVAQGLATGLSHMHRENIYHLDLKPDNFVIDLKGVVYIIDFGCAMESSGPIKGGIGDTRYYSPERLAHVRMGLPENRRVLKGEECFDGGKADRVCSGSHFSRARNR